MYPFFETIRVQNSEIKHLSYHQARMDDTCVTYYGKQNSHQLNEIITVPDEYSEGLVKLRLLYGEDTFRLEFSAYKIRPVRHLKLVETNSIDYRLKYSDRTPINNLLKYKEEYDDILIVKNGFITDTSYSNIIFFDGIEWVTPDSPLLKGTCRARLLDKGLLREAVIRPDDLEKFTHFSLINAMIGDNRRSLPIKNLHF